MRIRTLLLTLTALVCLAAGPVAPALASSKTDQIIRDCTDDGVLQGHYTQKQLQRALAAMPSDVAEYTNCSDVISAAIRAAAGGSGSAGFGTPVAPGTNPLTGATAADRAAVARAARDGGHGLRLDDGRPLGVVRPGELRPTAAAISTVPTPLLIAAILLVVGALAASMPWLKRLVVARRSK